MNNFKKFYFYLLVLLLSFSVITCNVGLGESVDLEAPVLTITEPDMNSYVRPKVELKGTCTDNIRVSSVTIYELKDGAETELTKAVIDGDKWFASLVLPEGDITLKCVATDPSKNVSNASIKTITLHIDENAPEGKMWTIERLNKISTNFYDFEKLSSFDYNLSANKHIPQNEEFTIKGRFFDAMGVIETGLYLDEVEFTTNAEGKDVLVLDSNGAPKIKHANLVVDIRDVSSYEIDEEHSNDKGNMYMPFYSFTHDDLVEKDSSFASGKHYIKVSYSALDKGGNDKKSEIGYFLWWPESDYPGIEQKDTVNGQLAVLKGGSFPLTFFDDDELKEIRYALISEDNLEYYGINEDNYVDKLLNLDSSSMKNGDLFFTKTYNGNTEDPLSVKASENSGIYYLAAYVQANDTAENTSSKWIQVTVSDASKPFIIITSPKENQIPEMNGSTISINGTVSDATGCKLIQIAYLPKDQRSSFEDRAKAIFDAPTKEEREAMCTGLEKYSEKILTNRVVKDNVVKEEFSFSFNILKDFGTIGSTESEANKAKTFVLCVTDIDNNKVYKQFNVLGDIEKPEITIAEPSNDMMVYDYNHSDLTIKFRATKKSNLDIDVSKYKISRVQNGQSTVIHQFAAGDAGVTGKDFVSYTIPQAKLKEWAVEEKDTQPKFEIEAVDILGNSSIARRVVVLSPLPVLKDIVFDKTEITAKAGDPIKLFAIFTDAAKVTIENSEKVPRIKLGNLEYENGNKVENAYAVLDSDTIKVGESLISDSLTFVYKVPEGIRTKEGKTLICEGDSIDLNGSKIETGGDGKGDATISFNSESLKADLISTLKVDGIKPYIKSFSARLIGNEDTILEKFFDGKYYATKNDEVLVDVIFNEDVLITGSPELSVNNNKTFKFQSGSGRVVTFRYKVVDGDNVELNCVKKSALNEESLKAIIDIAGNTAQAVSDSTSTPLNIVLDTANPNPPTLCKAGTNDLLKGGDFNQYQYFKVVPSSGNNPANDDYLLEYSIDAGKSWSMYKDLAKGVWGTYLVESTVGNLDNTEQILGDDTGVKIPTGTRQITARQKDKAGNVSASAPTVTITTQTVFPIVTEISIAKTDAYCKKDEIVDFNVFLEESVLAFDKLSDENLPTLTFAPYSADKNPVVDPNSTRTIKVTRSDKDTNKLTFTYTVTENDAFNNGIMITSVVLKGIQDKYNNGAEERTEAIINDLLAEKDPSTHLPVDSKKNTCKRPELILDGKPPVINWEADGTVANGGIVKSGNAAGQFKLKFTFDENIKYESGRIILQRKGDWAIPAVISSEEFISIMNKISSVNESDKEFLLETEVIDSVVKPKTHHQTGQEVGPYKLTTHGLNQNNVNGTYVPDTTSKYVLDFKYGLTESTTAGSAANKQVVTNIRNVLKKIDYDKIFLDVNASNVDFSGTDGFTSNVLTITFNDQIPDGREWEVVIPNDSFYDESGNAFAGFTLSSASNGEHYSVWSDKVAKPVVRVDRYSHGWGAVKKDSNGNVETTISAFSGRDGQTENNQNGSYNELSVFSNSGRTIAPWGFVDVRIDSETPGATIKYKTVAGGVSNFNVNDTSQNKIQPINDISKTKLDNATLNDTYASTFIVGNTGRIDVSSNYTQARKDYVVANALKDGFDSSDLGMEGVFKTVVIAYQNDNSNETNKQINVCGGTKEAGESTIDGFPLLDANPDKRYQKNMYLFQSNNKNYFAWVSYEIVSDWAILQRRKNWSSRYGKGSYGELTQLYNLTDYGWEN